MGQMTSTIPISDQIHKSVLVNVVTNSVVPVVLWKNRCNLGGRQLPPNAFVQNQTAPGSFLVCLSEASAKTVLPDLDFSGNEKSAEGFRKFVQACAKSGFKTCQSRKGYVKITFVGGHTSFVPKDNQFRTAIEAHKWNRTDPNTWISKSLASYLKKTGLEKDSAMLEMYRFLREELRRKVASTPISSKKTMEIQKEIDEIAAHALEKSFEIRWFEICYGPKMQTYEMKDACWTEVKDVLDDKKKILAIYSKTMMPNTAALNWDVVVYAGQLIESFDAVVFEFALYSYGRGF